MNEETMAVDVQEQQVFEFDKKLASIYALFLQNHQIDEDLDVALKEVMKHGKEDLDTASYVQILFMEGMKYEQKENKNAARYCALRILDIQQCYKNLKKKRPRLLDIQPYTFPDDMVQFIDRYTDYLEDTFRMINTRLLFITGVVFFIAAMLLTLILKINIAIAGVEAGLLGMLNYILQKRKIPIIFMKNQLQAIEHHVEEDVLAFDRPIRYS